MATKRKMLEDFIQRMKKMSKSASAPCICRFEDCEIEKLLEMFKELSGPKMKIDRTSFREELQTTFKITDDVLMDRIFRAFDRDSDGYIKQEEWILGLSVFLKGVLEERINFTFNVYDLNADGYISREEMFHLLKHCLIKIHSSEDDPEEGTKDLVEIMIKKLDHDHDGKISLKDFKTAVMDNPLLLESLGPCLPNEVTCRNFLCLLQSNLGHGGMRMQMQQRHRQEEDQHQREQRRNMEQQRNMGQQRIH